MAFVLVRPGTRTPLVTLNSLLKERHDNLRDWTAKRIEECKAKGYPLADPIDWSAAVAAVEQKDAAALRKLASGGLLEPLDEYAPVPGYDDVKLRLVALADERRAELALDIQLAQVERAALEGQPLKEAGKQALALDAAVAAAQVAFIRAAVAEMHTSEGPINLGSDDDVAAIRATGPLLAHLLAAAQSAQGLSFPKEQRCGPSQRSTT